MELVWKGCNKWKDEDRMRHLSTCRSGSGQANFYLCKGQDLSITHDMHLACECCTGCHVDLSANAHHDVQGLCEQMYRSASLYNATGFEGCPMLSCFWICMDISSTYKPDFKSDRILYSNMSHPREEMGCAGA